MKAMIIITHSDFVDENSNNVFSLCICSVLVSGILKIIKNKYNKNLETVQTLRILETEYFDRLFFKFWMMKHPKFNTTHLQKFHIWYSFPCAGASHCNLNNDKPSRLTVQTCFLDSLVIHNCWKQSLLFTAKVLSIICCLILLEGLISVYWTIWICFVKFPFNAIWNVNYLSWFFFSPVLWKMTHGLS